jgi:hypothetical protein
MPVVAVRIGLAGAAAVALAACGSVMPAAVSGPGPHSPSTDPAKAVSTITAPPAGTRADADALASTLLSQLRLPGARRLPSLPVPQSLRQPALWGLATASVDRHRLFESGQPIQAVAAALAAKVPAGMTLAGTGGGGGPAGPTSAEVSYAARSVPAGVDAAQLALTVVPDSSGGSLVRADAQVIWYPPRTPAEYINPGGFHSLTIAVTIYGRHLHTIRKVFTSPAAIRQVAGVLDRSRVNPAMTISCPIIFAEYRLAFAVSPRSVPAVVVTASRWPCEGARVRADGRIQPSLQDAGGVVAAADRLLGVNPRP